MPASPWVSDVAEATFEQEVIERSRQVPVVVDFWAPWCGPCRMLGPVLEKLVEERRGEVVLAKVNIDDNPALAAAFHVQSIPAVIAFRDGQPVLNFVGALPESQLRLFLEQLLPSEAERLVKQAQSLEGSNPTEAEALYRRALAQDRKQEAAALGLARLLLARGAEDEAADLLEEAAGEEAERLQAVLFLHRRAREFGDEAAARKRLEAEPESAQRRYELGCVLAAAGKYPEALEMLLSAAERDPKLAGTVVRETMVQVFYALGPSSPLADEYRARLTGLLY